jgi:hypothetical protein
MVGAMRLAVALVILACLQLASIPKVGTGPRPGIVIIQPDHGKIPPDSVHVMRVDDPKARPVLVARLILTPQPLLLTASGEILRASRTYDGPSDSVAVWNVSTDGVLYFGFVDAPQPRGWKGLYEFCAFWNGKGHCFPELRK